MNVRKRVMNMNADSTVALNYKIIQDFYTKNYGTPYAPELHQEEVAPGWTVATSVWLFSCRKRYYSPA